MFGGEVRTNLDAPLEVVEVDGQVGRVLDGVTHGQSVPASCTVLSEHGKVPGKFLQEGEGIGHDSLAQLGPGGVQ